jgi:hypothetical protein
MNRNAFIGFTITTLLSLVYHTVVFLGLNRYLGVELAPYVLFAITIFLIQFAYGFSITFFSGLMTPWWLFFGGLALNVVPGIFVFGPGYPVLVLVGIWASLMLLLIGYGLRLTYGWVSLKIVR